MKLMLANTSIRQIFLEKFINLKTESKRLFHKNLEPSNMKHFCTGFGYQKSAIFGNPIINLTIWT